MIKQTTRKEMIAAAINELADEHGVISAERVFEAARSANSPLHDEFEWNGDVAVRELGLKRAAELIRTIRVEIVVQSHKIVCPVYVNDPRDSQAGKYLPIAAAASNAAIANGVLVNEISRIESAIRRARAIAGALNVEDEFERMVASIDVIRSRIKEAA